jgi:protein gp37
MGKTNIEWAGHVWNPIIGCSIVSPGCTNCYAMKMAARTEAMGISRYDGTTRKVNGNVVWTGKLAQAPEETLLAPLRRKKPTIYFVNSMSDLFHEKVPDEWIDRIFAVMALTPQHTYQVLTKRAGRMRDYLCRHDVGLRWVNAADVLLDRKSAFAIVDPITAVGWTNHGLPNVWLGVSTERQQEADERIPLLLQTPAAVRFISAEPLLGPIDLMPWIMDGCEHCDDDRGSCGGPRCHRDDIPRSEQCPEKFAIFDETQGPADEDGAPAWIRAERIILDWVIVGGESGPGYRPMSPEWAESLRDQCIEAGVPVFIKQMAGKKPIPPELLVRQLPEARA